MFAMKSVTYTALFFMVIFSIVQVAAQEAQPASSTQAPLTLTLQDALTRARNSVQFQAALTDRGLAHEDKVQARAALLPNVNYHNQFIYTQGAGLVVTATTPTPTATPAPRFIANNAVHEYVSQAIAEEVLGYAQISDYRRARAL
ncbi:MAG TPA: TolC family protein, partial [Candidatus Dormibacteraeota bacterium]|nr:TolC family protein [Candidatus Dormibacteraeota bacterium]